VAVLKEGPLVPEQKREKQRPDVCPVHVGVRENDDALVAQGRQVKLLALQQGGKQHKWGARGKQGGARTEADRSKT
jgi:hypothetical protein